MAEVKLNKLPDRTPTKVTFTASAELNQALGQYAEMYRAAYGVAEPVPELIPFMLEAFLESDRGFTHARKQRPPLPRSEPNSVSGHERSEAKRRSATPES